MYYLGKARVIRPSFGAADSEVKKTATSDLVGYVAGAGLLLIGAVYFFSSHPKASKPEGFKANRRKHRRN